MKNNWKACLYIRLSREDGDKAESDSVTNQRALLYEYASNNPQIEICGEFVDDGVSGVDFNRPSFIAMMEQVKRGEYDCILVKDLSRFGRNWIESGRYIEQIFPYIGIRFIAVTDNYDSLVAKNSGDNISLPFKNLINDAYAADISVKIRSQLATKRKKGDFIGAFATFGYVKCIDNHNKLIVDEFAANVVRDIFRWRIDGMSNAGIANRLNEMGIASPYEYKRANGMDYSNSFKRNSKALWSAVAIGRILVNEIYLGVLEQGKRTSKSHKVKNRINKTKEDWIRVENTHEAIISHKDFTLVAELLSQDVRIAPGNDELYLFSGLLKCNDCGQNMVRKLVPSGNKKYVYYVCSTSKVSKSCTPHNISEKILTDAVYHSVKAHIAAIVDLERILKFIDHDMPKMQSAVVKLDSRIDTKKQEIEKYQMRKLRLYEDLQDDIIDKDEYERYKLDFTKLHKEAEQALELLLKELDDVLNNQGDSHKWIEHFKEHSNIKELSRGALVSLVERIKVREKNCINIQFKYQHNFDLAKNLVSTQLNKEVV
ncbi:MAG: recombinase family protein [Defluviitaleaceae bacterium]|nr:recombinase family protein [Defluviitaleaceae bacterium]